MESKGESSHIGRIKVRTNLWSSPRPEVQDEGESSNVEELPNLPSKPVDEGESSNVEELPNLPSKPVDEGTPSQPKLITIRKDLGATPCDEPDNEGKPSQPNIITIRKDLGATPCDEPDIEGKPSQRNIITIRKDLGATPCDEPDIEGKPSQPNIITIRKDLGATPCDEPDNEGKPSQPNIITIRKDLGATPCDEPDIEGCSTSTVEETEALEEDEENSVVGEDHLTEHQWSRNEAPHHLPYYEQDQRAPSPVLPNNEAGPSGIKRKMADCPFIIVDDSKACHMAFHRTSCELAVAYPKCLKYFSIPDQDREDAETKLLRTLSLPEQIDQISYRSYNSHVMAITATQLFCMTDESNVRNVCEFEQIVCAMDAGDIFVIVGTEEGYVAAIEIETARFEFFIQVADDPIQSLFLREPFIFGNAGRRFFMIDIGKESIENTCESPCDVQCAILHGAYFVVGTTDGLMVLFTLPHLSVHEYNQVTRGVPVTSLASVGDTQIAVGSEDGNLKLFYINPIEEAVHLTTLAGPVSALSVSYNSLWLAANDMQNCKLFPLSIHSKKRKPAVIEPCVPMPIPSTSVPTAPVPGFPMPYMDVGFNIKQEPVDPEESPASPTEPMPDFSMPYMDVGFQINQEPGEPEEFPALMNIKQEPEDSSYDCS